MNIDVFVIAGGKCGSTTLKSSFDYNGFRCIKSHAPSCFIKQFGYNGFYKTIEMVARTRYIFVIDAYRTPIERKLSSFFHNGDKKHKDFNQLSLSELTNIFNREYLYTVEEYHIMNDIFNKYKIPRFTTFPHNKQIKIKTHKNIVFIKLLYKNIQNWESQLRKIFGNRFKIMKANMSNEKPYHTKYKRFLAKYKVHNEYLDNNLVNDAEFKLYNSPQDQQEYIAMWKTKST